MTAVRNGLAVHDGQRVTGRACFYGRGRRILDNAPLYLVRDVECEVCASGERLVYGHLWLLLDPQERRKLPRKCAFGFTARVCAYRSRDNRLNYGLTAVRVQEVLG